MQYSNVLEMENRLVDLRKKEKDADKQLQFLAGIKRKQLGCIEEGNLKGQKQEEQVNVYKYQLRELHNQRKDTKVETKKLKGDNTELEKNIEFIRKQNEKLAKAIRRVKEDPKLVEEVKHVD